MTGPFLLPQPSPDHKTTGCDIEYHPFHTTLENDRGGTENEDGCTNGLLSTSDGEELEEHAPISASKAAQGTEERADHDIPITSQPISHTRATRHRTSVPPGVSLLNNSIVPPLPIALQVERSRNSPIAFYCSLSTIVPISLLRVNNRIVPSRLCRSSSDVDDFPSFTICLTYTCAHFPNFSSLLTSS